MRGNKDNHVPIPGKGFDKLLDILVPLYHSLILSNIKGKVDDFESVIIVIIFGEKVIHYCKVGILADGVKSQM